MTFVLVLVAATGALLMGVWVGALLAVSRRAGAGASASSDVDRALRSAVEQLVELNRSMQSAGSIELSAKKELIDERLAAIRQELDRELDHVSALIEQVGRTSERGFERVVEQLSQQRDLTTSLRVTAHGLREALASPKMRGQWGERMVDEVLRAAGLVEHINFERQQQVEGGRGIPDVTLLLPKGHVLYMDVKFPLTNYLRAHEADSEPARLAHREQFLRDVRLRVRELSKREYASSTSVSLDAVLLFIPNETINTFIHEHDPELLDEAFRLKVVLCTPLSLFALLSVIRQAFDNFVVERTSDEMLQALGAFRLQYEKFGDCLDRLGKSLGTSQKLFDDLNGPRRRQLEKPVARLDELRVERRLPPLSELAPNADVVELSQFEGLGA